MPQSKHELVKEQGRASLTMSVLTIRPEHKMLAQVLAHCL